MYIEAFSIVCILWLCVTVLCYDLSLTISQLFEEKKEKWRNYFRIGILRILANFLHAYIYLMVEPT